MSFVVFSDDWGGHPSSCQHIFRRICRERPVIWVNTVGMRLPRPGLGDAKKALFKIGRMLRGPAPGETTPSPAVISPFMTPFERPAFLREWNVRAVTRGVLRAIEELKLDAPTIVTTVPNVHEAVARLKRGRVVYYAVDDFSEWPGMDKQRILAMEDALLRSVDVVIASSHSLLERFRGRFPAHLLTHGVDLELFSSRPAREHDVLRGIPGPRVGYFGLLDGRTDEGLLVDVIGRVPQVSFVFTGPVEGKHQELRRLANAYFTGPVDYRELPAVTMGWKACILPYKLNELTEKINPLKLKEYIATGKPVLATPLPEARLLVPHVMVAATADAWESGIHAAIDGRWTAVAGARASFLEPHGWDRKAQDFLRICEETGCAVAAT